MGLVKTITAKTKKKSQTPCEVFTEREEGGGKEGAKNIVIKNQG